VISVFPKLEGFKSILYVKILERLVDLKTPLTTAKADDVIERLNEIRRECRKRYMDLGYQYFMECYTEESAKELTPLFREHLMIIAWDYLENNVVFIRPEQLGFEPKAYYGHIVYPEVEPKDIIRQYEISYNRKAKYLGIYHSHPLEIPVAGERDAEVAEEYKSLLDMIDNADVGWVVAIGGWSGFVRVEDIRKEFDEIGYIYYYGHRTARVYLCRRDKMMKLTHKNLIENSKYLPDKVYIWKTIDEDYRIYQRGKYRVIKGENIHRHINEWLASIKGVPI